MNHYNHRISSIENRESSIENPVIYVPIRHLYICRELSTNQPFLCKTNPILSAVGGLQMNLSILSKMTYDNKSNWTLGQNKPNQTQFKPNFRNAQNERKYLLYNRIQQKNRLPANTKQTQSNPISNPILFFPVAKQANAALYSENTDN